MKHNAKRRSRNANRGSTASTSTITTVTDTNSITSSTSSAATASTASTAFLSSTATSISAIHSPSDFAPIGNVINTEVMQMKKLITNLRNNNAELEKRLRSAQGVIFRTTDGWQKAIGDLQREQIHSEKLKKQMEYERSLSDARIKDLEFQLLSLQKQEAANNQPAIASTTTSVSVESSVSQPATATTSATLAANNMWTSPPTSTSTAASTTSTSSGPLTDPKTPVFNG